MLTLLALLLILQNEKLTFHRKEKCYGQYEAVSLTHTEKAACLPNVFNKVLNGEWQTIQFTCHTKPYET